MQNIPLVSIIIPAFNTEKYIGNMLRNVLQQTYNNYEVLQIIPLILLKILWEVK